MKYEKIRAALAAMPTEGPWFHHHPAGSQHSSGGYVSASEDRREDALCHVCYEGSGVPALINGAFIAACNPTAVSALLSERDALVEALELIADTDPDEDTAWFHDIAHKALAAHRSQGGEYRWRDFGDGKPIRVQVCSMCGVAPTNVDDCGEFGNPECPYFGIGLEEYEKQFGGKESSHDKQ